MDFLITCYSSLPHAFNEHVFKKQLLQIKADQLIRADNTNVVFN